MTGLILTLLTHLVAAAYAGVTTGPFDLVFSTIGKCPAGFSENDNFIHDVKLKRVSRNKVMFSVNGSISTPFGDDHSVQFNMAKQTNQGWKDNFFIINVPHACTAVHTYIPELEQEVARQLHIKSLKCPIPVGNFSVTLPFNMNIKSVPVFTYGSYRSRFFILRKERKIVCLETIVSFVPKKSG